MTWAGLEGAAAGAGAEAADGQMGSGAKKPAMSAYGVDETGRIVEEWDYLNRFFKRFNKVWRGISPRCLPRAGSQEEQSVDGCGGLFACR